VGRDGSVLAAPAEELEHREEQVDEVEVMSPISC
jgi:hypothetical protein